MDPSVSTDDSEEAIVLQRPCTQLQFNATYQYRERKKSTFCQTLKQCYCNCSVLPILLSLFPVVTWLSMYSTREYILSDLVSGFTVAIMHIPQGMAYAALGAVHPIVGLYMAVFPVLIYFLMGTSRHISLGSFSLVCLMASKPVTMNSDGSTNSSILVAAVVSLTVGLLQLILGLCQVGSLAKFMSESLISGFTTGAAVLVFVSQLTHVFGIKVKQYFGIFNSVYTVFDLVSLLPKTNYLALLMSITVISLLLIYANLIKPRLNCKFLFPMELVVLIVGTLISHYFSLNHLYSIDIVGPIPRGIPAPEVPPIELMPSVAVDSLVIAIVSYSIHISMANILALKNDYKINANQELIACGFGNVIGGFFSCLPVGVSLSRSMVQYTTGGKTQLASVFSCAFLILVLLYFGTFLEPLPFSVLAGIVIASLKTMLMQVTNLPRIWRQSAIDGTVWLLTFLATVVLDIVVGLGIALLLSVCYIILMNQRTYLCVLGRILDTDIFLDMERYLAAKPVPDFIIVQIQAGLHFANIHVVTHKLEVLLDKTLRGEEQGRGLTLVVDMSCVPFTDPGALHHLKYFISELKRQNISVRFAHCTLRVYEQMTSCNLFKDFSNTGLFPTVQDAVLFNPSNIFD